jgi:cobalamin biosynthesis Mg chelatase CobN
VPGGTDKNGTFGIVTFKVKAPGEAKVTINPDSLVLSGGENKMAGSGQTVSYTLVAPPNQQAPVSADKNTPKADKGPQQKKDEAVAAQGEVGADSGSQPEEAANTPLSSAESNINQGDQKVVILDSEGSKYNDKVQIVHWSLRKKIIFFTVVGIALLAATAGIMYFYGKYRRKIKVWPL